MKTDPKAGTEKMQDNGQINMVGKGATIEGTLEVGGDVRVGGKVNGEVRVQGRLVITPEGRIEGLVSTREADIAGQVKGDIIAQDRLVVRKSAVIQGNIAAAKLVIEDGAIFEGQCHMRSAPRPATAKPTGAQAGAQAAAAKPTGTQPGASKPVVATKPVAAPSPNKGDGAKESAEHLQLNVNKQGPPSVARR